MATTSSAALFEKNDLSTRCLSQATSNIYPQAADSQQNSHTASVFVSMNPIAADSKWEIIFFDWPLISQAPVHHSAK